jgi:hypothetical protein
MELERGSSNLEIDTGNGDDAVFVRIDAVFARGLDVRTGNGDDSVVVDFSNSRFADLFEIDTGNGSDFVGLNFGSESFPRMQILSIVSTGRGEDVVELDGQFLSYTPTLFISLGSGDDSLIGDSDPSYNPARIRADGGTGFDSILNQGYFALSSLLPDFERFVD